MLQKLVSEGLRARINVKGKVRAGDGSIGGTGMHRRALAQRGCNVMIHGLEDAAIVEEKRDAMAKEFRVQVVSSRVDLSNPAEIENLVLETEKKLGPIEILVNNAVTRQHGPLDEMAVEKWDLALAVNLSAPFHTIRLTLPGMKKRGWGRIINIASNWGQTGPRNRADSSRASMVSLDYCGGCAETGIRITCNAIAPGP